MRIALLITLLAAITGLSACQTMTPEERRAADEQRCLSYGFRRGTDGFATCLQRIDLDRRAGKYKFKQIPQRLLMGDSTIPIK